MNAPAPHGLRLWLFRLAALTLVPLALLLALELGLRLAGFGFPTGFLVPAEGQGGVFVSNSRFGWRFFPPRIARAPVPFELAEPKPEGVVRVLVVGGSAARGTPQPAFGLARHLEAILEATAPGTRFEVVNGAMTAVSSHVVLPIVRDLARHRPDVVVAYLGNNEVVGPYGAGSVFGTFSSDPRVVRAAIAFKATRLGQLFDRALGGAAGSAEWRGMEMFLEHRLAADDPRLDAVVKHFRRNLTDLVAAARGAGARVVLSTVAVDVVDQPPFASLHRPGLAASEEARFAELLEQGRAALARATTPADLDRALGRFEEAAAIDDRYAELAYWQGRALLAGGRLEEARAKLLAARDLDALRFRADSRLEAVIREVAQAESVALVDAERFFLDGAGFGAPLPGRPLFFDHVHPSFAGTYALARAVFTELRGVLPAGVDASGAPPTLDAVAERLAFTPFEAVAMEREILEIVSRPPFTGLPGHAAELASRRRRLRELRRTLGAADGERALALVEARLAARPDDVLSRERLAELLRTLGRPERAVEEWRRLVARFPDQAEWRDTLALALAAAGRPDEALVELESSRRRFPELAGKIVVNEGSILERAGRFDEAAARYREAASLDPSLPSPLYNLATLTARQGELDAAVDLYRELVERHPTFARGHHNLGVALERRGELEAAAASYHREIEADPWGASGHASLAFVLEALERPEEAAREYVRALELEPDHAPALFGLADFLLARGRAAEAAPLYEEGLKADPGNEQARKNLGLARETAASPRTGG